MKKKIILPVLSLLILALYIWSGQERSIKDEMGQSFILGSPPQRIVSLAPNITEILYVLGLGKRPEKQIQYILIGEQKVPSEKKYL